MLKKILCSAGLHRPLLEHRYLFVDKVSGLTVYRARCKCGRKWMTDSSSGFCGFKTELIDTNRRSNSGELEKNAALGVGLTARHVRKINAANNDNDRRDDLFE